MVLSDPCGRAWLAASAEDWLIPSGILGSTVFGLISRSILNEDAR
ncbi:cysteine protease StiP domain-containing protein [Mesorhizobium sp. M1409]